MTSPTHPKSTEEPSEADAIRAVMRDLVEVWEGEAERCDASAKRLGGGWASRAQALRDCARTLKGLVSK